MDSIFFLEGEARRLFLREAGRALGSCLYILLWSYIPPPSNCLVCMDGWFHEDDAPQHSTSSLSTISHRLFEAYKGSISSIQDSCVPGLAFKQGLPYFELKESDLLSSSSLPVQQQFYQEAGVKTAIFLGCNKGEAEIGMSTLITNMNMQMEIRQLFTELMIIPSDRSMASSSSSSLRSLSIGSPEYSSLLLNKPSTSYLADTFRDTATEQATRTSHSVSIQSYPQYRHAWFPSPESEDAAMTKAMLAVISSSSSSSSSHSTPMSHQPVGAFTPYNPSLAPRTDPKNTSRLASQNMIKMAIALSRRINNLIKFKTQVQDPRPTSNQLHHMIAERKRREKLNESFLALRNLLPPGSKKDKASVLANTRDYLRTLKAEISQLQEKNEMLENKLMNITDHEIPENAQDSNEEFKVQITRLPESTSQGQRIILRIDVREECDIIVFVLRVLECLKSTSFISLVSINASTLSSQTPMFAQAALTLQVEASDWDEASFKETVTQAVAAALALPETES